MKTLVAYYSHGGNNRFLAEKLARDTGGDLVELRPRVKSFGFVLIASLTHLSFGNRKVRFPVADYDAVILCGPIYMGMLVAPLRDFMKSNRKKLKRLYFATCCGGGKKDKDTKFGYNAVFAKARAILGEKLAGCTAFSFELFAAEELKENPDGIMKIKLTEDKFTGAVAARYTEFLGELKK
jgi:menaquinone-dependent protoporphyrinogen IX oxidase